MIEARPSSGRTERASRGTVGLLIAASLALCLAAAWIGSREAAPFLAFAGNDSEAWAQLGRGTIPAGLSVTSQRVGLDECVEGITSLYGRTRATTARQQVFANCALFAEGVVAAMPSYSYAWYVLALARAELGEPEAMNAALLRAQQTGPSEQWVAELRVGLAEQHFADLGPEMREHHARDLALLAQSRRGIRSIARRYAADPAFRERVTAVVETLPDNVQARFVKEVRAAADQWTANPDNGG